MAINVRSEIKPLKKVLLHRPGKELLNLTPDTLGRLLFDDIPFLKVAQQEHDSFALILKDNGVEVVYLEDLAAETISQCPDLRKKFIEQFIVEGGVYTEEYQKALFNFFDAIKDNKELILKTMEGVRYGELSVPSESLVTKINDDKDELILDPMPNLYFTRDPFASIGNGVSMNRMYSVTRNRETIYAHTILSPPTATYRLDIYARRSVSDGLCRSRLRSGRRQSGRSRSSSPSRRYPETGFGCVQSQTLYRQTPDHRRPCRPLRQNPRRPQRPYHCRTRSQRCFAQSDRYPIRPQPARNGCRRIS